MKRRFWLARVLVAVVLAAAFMGRAAAAQDEESSDNPLDRLTPSPERTFPIAIVKADVTSFARWNGLSKEQRDAALMLYSSYSERHAAAARKLWEYQEALSGGDSASLWRSNEQSEKIAPVHLDFTKHTKKLKDEFTEGLLALLTPEQEPARKWLDQRLKYRESVALLWVIGRQNPDLVRLMEQVLPAEQTPDGAREVVNKYVAECASLMDEALEQRKAAFDERVEQGDDADEDPEAVRKARDAWRGPMVAKAHDALVSALDRIKKALPAEQGMLLESRVYMAMVMGDFDISANRVIQRVERLESLTPDQRAQIADARTTYQKALIEQVKSQIERSVKAYEAGTDRTAELGTELGAMWQELTALAEAATTRMRDVLTPEQREEAGPPISTSKVAAPDFDSDDDAPAAKLTAGQERFMRLAASWAPGPEISEFDLRRLGRSAKFTPEQVEAAKELHAGYMARFRAAARKYGEFQTQAAQSNMGGMPAKEDLKRQFGVWAKYDRHKDRLREDLISDIEVLLTDEQKPSLELLRSASTRKRGGEGELVMMSPGAGVDLPMLVRSALRDREPSDELAAALDRYERDMAPSSGRLLELSRSVQGTMLKSLEEDGEFNMATMMSAMNEAQSELDKPLDECREVSFRCFQQVSPLMPEDVRDEFEESFYRAAGGGRLTEMQQSMMSGGKSARGLAEEMLRLSDLSDEQRSSLSAAQREHARAMRDISKAIYERMLAKMAEAKEPMQRRFVFTDSEVMKKSTERREADTKMLDRLMAILTPEQQGRLPMPYRPPGQIARPNFDEE